MPLNVLLALLMFTGSLSALAQTRFPQTDKSPVDLSYYPANYPVLKIQNKASEPVVARVIYSRPSKNGRSIFGELVEYGKIWRLGANEATEIEFFRDVKISGTKVKKGRYTLYALPYPDKWTIILNRETDVWGAFLYDPKKDVLRADQYTEKNTENIDAFSLVFEPAAKGAQLVFAWDDVITRLPFTW